MGGENGAGLGEVIGASSIIVSIPTPFRGRRDASSGRSWAGRLESYKVKISYFLISISESLFPKLHSSQRV